eukprot:scaffold22915_cov27-Tisochrysis_lutea.AAC.2
METLQEARTIMRRDAPSGSTFVAVSTRIGQAVSRNTLAAASIANVEFDVAVMGRCWHRQDLDAKVVQY